MVDAGGALELLVVERGLLSAAELTRLKAAGGVQGALVLAGHLVAMGRLRPDQLPALLAEAEALARPAPAPPPAQAPARGLASSARFQAAVTVIDEERERENVTAEEEPLDPSLTAPPQPASTVSEERHSTEPLDDHSGSGFVLAGSAPESDSDSGTGSPSSSSSGARSARGGARGANRWIGRYLVMEELGRGAMGVVYRVRAEGDAARELALKLLRETSPGRLKRFQEELRLLLRLGHPNLARVRDGGLDERGRPWFVMDLVPGQDLRDAIKEGRLTPERSARLVATMARALQHAHEQGVLHRDLKPENVRVDADLNPTIVDFGLAKDLEESGGLTRTGAAVGTPNYMAPEQALGQTHEVDARTDVWALGVVLYELLAGDVPFQAESGEELARRILRAQPRPLSELGREVPPALEAVCLRALAKSREARWPSAGAMAQALDEALDDGRGPWARPVPPWLAWVTAGAAGLALLALLVSLQRSDPETPPTSQRPGTDVAAPSSGSPAAPTPLDEARALARAGRREEALRRLGSGQGGSSFLRAERAVLLTESESESAAGHGLRLLVAAEAGCSRTAAARAGELLSAPELSSSPAALEARARAALLVHDPATAVAAASAALSAAPDDAQALRALARAQAAALEPEAVRVDLTHLEDATDLAGEVSLALAWETVARQLVRARALEPEGPLADEGRVWAAWAWTQALSRRLDAGGDPREAPLVADWDAARAELAPLLARIAAPRLGAARRALVRAAASSEQALEAAEDELAAAAATLGPCPRTALAAAHLAATLGGADARAWAEVWLGIAGDLPARALLALCAAARAQDPRERQRQLQRACRLGPDLPLVRWGALHLAPGQELGPLGGRDAAALQVLARCLSAAPELGPLLRQPLEATPLEPKELQEVLGGLTGQDRDTLLARALARLHTSGRLPEQGRLAAEEAARARALDPACAAAHQLLAEGLLQAGGPEVAVAACLEEAAAAAPAGPEPIRVRLLAQETPPSSEQVEPLLQQGWVTRLLRLLGRGRDDTPVLPPALDALLSDPDLDLAQPNRRQGLLTELERQALCPRLALALHLVRSSARDRARLAFVPGSRRASLEEWLPGALAQLAQDAPERWAAEALACSQELDRRLWADDAQRQALSARAARAALLGLVAAAPAGGDPWPREEQLRAVGVGPPGGEVGLLVPDAPELGWLWSQELRRPDLLRARLVEAIDAITRTPDAPPGAAHLSGEDLSDPWSHSRVLLDAVQVAEVQRRAEGWLLEGGESGEAYLALVRAAAFTRAGDAATAYCDRARDLAEDVLYAARAATPEGVELLEGYLDEGLVRWGRRPDERAVLQAQRADLLLWRAGSLPGGDARTRLLERADQALREAEPARLSQEPAFWGPWREARLRIALGEREAAIQALARANDALLRSRVSDPRRRAVLRDPLRPLLEPLPGFAQLVEGITPRR